MRKRKIRMIIRSPQPQSKEAKKTPTSKSLEMRRKTSFSDTSRQFS